MLIQPAASEAVVGVGGEQETSEPVAVKVNYF